LLEFAKKRSLVYREDLTGGMFYDAAEQVETHRAIVAQLRGIALNPHRSRELLEQIASQPAPLAQPVGSPEPRSVAHAGGLLDPDHSDDG
jgi:hypothetical protein